MRFAVSKVTATHPVTLERTLSWLPALMLATGCLGGNSNGIDPSLQAQRRELSKQTVETADLPSRAQRDEAAANEADEPATTDEEAPTTEEEDAPAPPHDDDPNTAEPAPMPHPDSSFSGDSVRCGDGVVDQDELCDIAIADGEPGACPADMGACDNSDPCYPENYVARGCQTHCEPAEPDPALCDH